MNALYDLLETKLFLSAALRFRAHCGVTYRKRGPKMSLRGLLSRGWNGQPAPLYGLGAKQSQILSHSPKSSAKLTMQRTTSAERTIVHF